MAKRKINEQKDKQQYIQKTRDRATATPQKNTGKPKG
jgi:hypothetical protein